MSVQGIRIYVEGGGDGSSGKAAIRRGFSAFLGPLRELARAQRLHWNITACGSRESAFAMFCTAIKHHSDSFVVLLVDSESQVPANTTPWAHLTIQDGWKMPNGAYHDSAHLMVQAMEAWILLDHDALKAYYGNGFSGNKLPDVSHTERTAPPQLESHLKDAARNTKKKTYHKIHDAEGLLKIVSLDTVCAHSEWCRRLRRVFEEITAKQ